MITLQDADGKLKVEGGFCYAWRGGGGDFYNDDDNEWICL
jgi:hypothetical protein